MTAASALRAALAAEALKLRRSKVPPLTAAAFSLAPLMGGLFMVILQDPERARRWGIVSAKAQLVGGAADWPTFLGLLGQSIAIGGSIVFAILAAWVFGREFADRTVKTALAVATPRWATVVAKLLVAAAWAAVITAWVLALGLAIGAAVGLPAVPATVIERGVLRIGVVALLTISLITPIAFAAGAGRGYMAPLGLALLLVFLAQIVAATGWGEWFPWAVPALYAGAAGEEAARMGAASFALVGAASLGGALATLVWWYRADHTT